MSSRRAFSALRTEGGLLPQDFLERLAAGDREIPGLDPEAFHLGPHERLGEAVNRSWSRLLGAWTAFRKELGDLPDGDAATGLTRERWLLPLFQELGYGRLVRSRAQELDGKSFAVSHLWHRSPIHLLGARLSLDQRAPGVAGAAASAPHGLVQEFLNRSEAHLWGFVSNGLALRVLRDHHSLTRQAFVEFDLETIFEGEQYAEFLLLWIVCHQSRVEAEKPEDCWLETWFQHSRDEGIRALDKLRDGVETAIAELGRGFLSHKGNRKLHVTLEEGSLGAQEYYRELLRLVYRMIFLFVAEDREALLDPEAPEEARSRYRRFYATSRLRELANRIRGGTHGDLWQALKVVMAGLHTGYSPLGLPGLGSFLWRPSAVPHLRDAELENRHLLAALRALCTIQDEGSRYPVNWRNIGSEELGSIYESLLELHPRLNREAGTFELEAAPGHERKTTSSYYTAPPLVEALLDLALEPLLDDAASRDDPEKAILDLKVCDPACGSGHFLVAAAHRIAGRLATVRSQDDQPSPSETQHALREVVGRCLFGVDLNPMAVELCKVSLWMEAIEPGRPLSFLETHVQCGNALLGTSPELMTDGIPDQAFATLEGDDKEIGKQLRKANKAERAGQTTLVADLISEPRAEYDDVASRILHLDEQPEDDLEAVRRKEEAWDAVQSSPEYRELWFQADFWCAAFFWPMTSTDLRHAAPTHDLWLGLLKDPASVPSLTREETRRLARHYRFFHWHLAFPQVFDHERPSKGFDLMLGNPPWDTLSPDTKEFFSAFDPQIRFEGRDGQKRIMAELLESEDIDEKWITYRRDLYATVHFIKSSGRYRLFAPGNLGKGDFNVYRMFAETALQLTRPGGFAAQLVPENVYNGANAMAIRRELFEEFDLRWLLGFENRRQIWFSGIDGRTRFALYSASKGGPTTAARTAFNVRTVEELEEAKRSPLRFPISLVHEFSPVALAFMEFERQLDIDIVEKMYSRFPNFGNQEAGPPFRHYMREVDMGTDRELFSDGPPGVPVYEGRMVAQYDHRAKGYRSGRGRSAVWEELDFSNPEKSIQPQWWIREEKIPDKVKKRYQRYRIGFCDVASPTNERTLVAALLPKQVIAGHSVPTFTFPDGWTWAYFYWLAVANSFCMDFLVRQKVSLHMTFSIMDSLPFPRSEMDDPGVQTLVPLAAGLCCCSKELEPFLEALEAEGFDLATVAGDRTNREWRQRTAAEIDAYVAREVFQFTRSELEYVLGTFPIVAKNDKKEFGELRTKKLILEAFESLEAGSRSSLGTTLEPRNESIG